MQKSIYIRNLDKVDLASIVNIEDRVTGIARPDYWEKRIEMAEGIRPHWASLVAEVDNRVVGFILGRSGELEFGLPGTVAWVEIIGVDPAYRSQGVARALIEHFMESADEHGVKTIFTLVESSSSELEGFFTRLGFVQGKMLHFQKQIG
jgi:ribosomal protein S18 acetylase RimI-like enzyme